MSIVSQLKWMTSYVFFYKDRQQCQSEILFWKTLYQRHFNLKLFSSFHFWKPLHPYYFQSSAEILYFLLQLADTVGFGDEGLFPCSFCFLSIFISWFLKGINISVHASPLLFQAHLWGHSSTSQQPSQQLVALSFFLYSDRHGTSAEGGLQPWNQQLFCILYLGHALNRPDVVNKQRLSHQRPSSPDSPQSILC